LYYFIALTVLAGPVSLIYSNAYPYDNIIKKFYGVYGRPEWWAIITIMCIGQALLLFVPIQITERKLKSKRPLLVPVITAAFMTTVLLSTLAIFITMTIIETEGFISGPLLDGLDLWNGYQWTALILLAWLFWSVFFYKATRTLEPESLMRRLTSWMLKGSILELLIAVPCHIFVRHRDHALLIRSGRILSVCGSPQTDKAGSLKRPGVSIFWLTTDALRDIPIIQRFATR
jgi:hypothetical protein